MGPGVYAGVQAAYVKVGFMRTLNCGITADDQRDLGIECRTVHSF